MFDYNKRNLETTESLRDIGINVEHSPLNMSQNSLTKWQD